jgi:hypothetical protein
MVNKRTAVQIHGCHLQADLNGLPWDDIVWGGEVPNLLGRGTMGLKVAVEYDAHLVLFSTGASTKNGLFEAEYTHKWALHHLDDIATAIKVSSETLLTVLHRSQLDTESNNTREECTRSLKLCMEYGIEQIIIVSSPWHIQRCHTEMQQIAETLRHEGVVVPEIMAVASHGSTEGVVVLEPPHRGDLPKTRFHELGGRFFKVSAGNVPQFEDSLDQLLKSFGA